MSSRALRQSFAAFVDINFNKKKLMTTTRMVLRLVSVRRGGGGARWHEYHTTADSSINTTTVSILQVVAQSHRHRSSTLAVLYWDSQHRVAFRKTRLLLEITGVRSFALLLAYAVLLYYCGYKRPVIFCFVLRETSSTQHRHPVPVVRSTPVWYGQHDKLLAKVVLSYEGPTTKQFTPEYNRTSCPSSVQAAGRHRQHS